MFEAKYKVVTESDLSAKQFDDAFKPILVSSIPTKLVGQGPCSRGVMSSGTLFALLSQSPGQPPGKTHTAMRTIEKYAALQTARERIEVIALESIRLDDQNEGDEEMQELKLRGRGLLQSGDVPSGSAAAAAASLNPGASMQGRMPYKTFLYSLTSRTKHLCGCTTPLHGSQDCIPVCKAALSHYRKPAQGPPHSASASSQELRDNAASFL